MASTSKKKKFASLRTPMKEVDVNEILDQLFTSKEKVDPSPFDNDDLEFSFRKKVPLLDDRPFKEGDSYVDNLEDGYEDDPYRSLIIEPPPTTPYRSLNVKRVEFRSERKLRSSNAVDTPTPRTDRLFTSSTPVDKPPPTPMTGVKPLAPETPPVTRCTPFTSTPLNVSTASAGGIPYKFNVDYESPTKDMSDEERANILLGITCYVEARNDKDDASEAVKGELLKLGAKIEKNFTRKVTHIIFKEGRMSTYLKAKQWGIPLVSVLWIDACKRARHPVDPTQYRPKKMEKYDNVPPWAFLKKRRFGGLIKLIRGGKNDLRDERADSLIEQRSQDVSTPLLKLRRGDDKAISDTKHRRRALPGTKGVFSKKKLDFDSQEQLKLDKNVNSDKLRRSAPAELQNEVNCSTEDETASTSTEDSQTLRVKELTGGLSQARGGRRKVRRLLHPASQALNFDSEDTPRTSDDESSRCVSPPQFPSASADTAAVQLKKRRRRGSESSRRESLMPLSHMTDCRDPELNKKKSPPCLVISGFTPDEKSTFLEIINSLGKFEYDKNVTKRTTHLVTCCPVKRTVNVVKALSRGCWILSVDWIHRSKQCGKWMPEESFELTSFSPAVKKNRLERQAFGRITLDLFSKCGRIYVSRKTQPSQSDLTELLRLGRACLTRVIGRADLVVDGSNSSRAVDIRTVKETWVLDCITQGKTLDPSDYLT